MVQLAEISWTEAEKILKENDVVLLPVGSTEQHGPHNPLGTDYLVAGAFTKSVGDSTGCLVLPTIPIGVSVHHRQFPGTLWVKPSLLTDYVVSICLSMASHGATKFLLMNGHGGNSNALMDASGVLRRDYDLFGAEIFAMPPGPDGHAGDLETSLNLYYHPELVDMSRAVDQVQNENLGPFKIDGYSQIGPAKFANDTADLSESGVLGRAGRTIYATRATAENARVKLEPFLDDVCEFVEKLKKANLEDLGCKPHK